MISDVLGVRNLADVKAIITSLRKECSPTEYQCIENRYFDKISKTYKKIIHISQSFQSQ